MTRPWLVAIALAALLAGGFAAARLLDDPPPNVILILTDDQRYDSTPALRFMDGRADWIRFPNAFVNTPVCCPSRATIFTGRYSHHTGVRRNRDGKRFDDRRTLATWLDDAGYETGMFGKYLNGYPWKTRRPTYIPPGWDAWHVFLEKSGEEEGRTTGYYEDYTLNEDGRLRRPSGHSTDVLAERALDFIGEAIEEGRPFFLEFAPYAPHEPWTAVAARPRAQPRRRSPLARVQRGRHERQAGLLPRAGAAWTRGASRPIGAATTRRCGASTTPCAACSRCSRAAGRSTRR